MKFRPYWTKNQIEINIEMEWSNVWNTDIFVQDTGMQILFHIDILKTTLYPDFVYYHTDNLPWFQALKMNKNQSTKWKQMQKFEFETKIFL